MDNTVTVLYRTSSRGGFDLTFFAGTTPVGSAWSGSRSKQVAKRNARAYCSVRSWKIAPAVCGELAEVWL
jgi:hypothetical protein